MWYTSAPRWEPVCYAEFGTSLSTAKCASLLLIGLRPLAKLLTSPLIGTLLAGVGTHPTDSSLLLLSVNDSESFAILFDEFNRAVFSFSFTFAFTFALSVALAFSVSLSFESDSCHFLGRVFPFL